MSLEHSGRQHIDPVLLAKIDQSEKDGGYWLKNIPEGTLIKAKTRNSLYVMARVEQGDSNKVAVVGGQHIVKPMIGYLRGSTFGGSMIRIGWIGLGMHLEINLSDGRLLTTSPVQEVTLENNPNETAAMIKLAESNSPKEATKEEVEQHIQKFIEEKFSAEIQPEVKNLAQSFSLNGQIAIVSLLAFAYEQNKFGKATELVKKFYQEHWGYQPMEVCGDPGFSPANAFYLKRTYEELGITLPGSK